MPGFATAARPGRDRRRPSQSPRKIRAGDAPFDQIRGPCLSHYVRQPRTERHGRRLWRTRLVILTALIPVVSGCGLLGGISDTRLGSVESMTVTSPVFGPTVRLPKIYTCHGAHLSPPLQWSGAGSPAIKSYAIVVDDSQAPITPYVYWIVFDLNPSTVAIGQSQLPTGARQAQNSAGKVGYDPPCPQGRPCPQGKPHLYRFTVYALNSTIKLRNGAGLRQAWSAIAQHVIGTGRLTAGACP